MFLLPKTIGAFTLQRKLGTGGVAETYLGAVGGESPRTVVVRRILPFVLRDPMRLASIQARVHDLAGIKHPFVVQILDLVQEGEELFVVEEYIDGISLERVLTWCRQAGRSVPPNVFLNIATQVCNGLEALHAREGKATQSENVLHLALRPGAIFLNRQGKVVLGSYGLTRSPTMLPSGGVSGPVPVRMEYVSPEQTHPDQKLSPPSDIFSLASVLYELLTLESLFRAESNLQTIHRIRRAEVASALATVRDRMPGLEKVLFRALSLNPRHRYQRAFVLREDIRGLMAGYSFASIGEETRSFLTPLFEQSGSFMADAVASAPDLGPGASDFEDSPDTGIDADPLATARAAAEARALRASQTTLAESFGEGERTENLSPAEVDPVTTVGPAPEAPAELDRPTVASKLPYVPETTAGLLAAHAALLPPEPPAVGRLLPQMEGINVNSTAGYLAAEGLAPPGVAPAPQVEVEPEPENTSAHLAAAGLVEPEPPRPLHLLPTPTSDPTSSTGDARADEPPPPAAPAPALSRAMPPPGIASRPMPPPSTGRTPASERPTTLSPPPEPVGIGRAHV